MNAELESTTLSHQDEQERAVGPGARLREAREARGLTLGQAADQLKLKKSIIEALEADEYQRLPSILFARGYLRSYARLLALPIDEVIRTFEELGLVEAQPAMPKGAILTSKRRGEHLVLKWGSVAVLLVLGGLLIAWFQGESTSSLLARLGINGTSPNGTQTSARVELQTQPPSAQPEIKMTQPDAPPPAVQPETEPLPQAKSESVKPVPARVEEPVTSPSTPLPTETARLEPPVPDSPEVEQPVEPRTPQTLVEKPPESLEPAETPASAPTAVDGNDRLVLELTEDSWAEVTDAQDQRLLYQLLKAGSVQEVTGLSPFRIFLGNAPGVELRFNGEPITDIRSNSRGVARFTLGETPSNAR